MGHASVVEAVLAERQEVPVPRQLDRVRPAASFARQVVELQQSLEREGDVEGELARLEDVVQFQAPRPDALGGGAQLVLDKREVEARPVERAQPIRPVQERHELLRAVEHGDELAPLVQSGHDEDLLQPGVRVVGRRAGDQARRRVQTGRLQVKGQHLLESTRGEGCAPPRSRWPHFFSETLVQTERAGPQVKLHRLGLPRVHHLQVLPERVARTLQLATRPDHPHQFPAHRQGRGWGLVITRGGHVDVFFIFAGLDRAGIIRDLLVFLFFRTGLFFLL